MTTVTVGVYDYDPYGNLPQSSGAQFTYAGPGSYESYITITDNGPGTEDLTLEDGSQGEDALGTITIDGDTSTNVDVSADEAWTVLDLVTGHTFQVVTLHVESGDASGHYMISERAMIPGREYRVIEFDSQPNVDSGDPVFTYSDYVCFASGTMIATPSGETPVEQLAEGDLVMTLDHGQQPLRWIGCRHLKFDHSNTSQRPIQIKRQSLNGTYPTQDLSVSPQHRILMSLPDEKRYPREKKRLVSAKSLLPLPGVRLQTGAKQVCYYSLLTPQHEILFANGLAAESFYPGRYALTLLTWLDRLKLTAAYPGVQQDPRNAYGGRVRPLLESCSKRKTTAQCNFRFYGNDLPAVESQGALLHQGGDASTGLNTKKEDTSCAASSLPETGK